MRIMLDTNILISIIFFPSGVTRILPDGWDWETGLYYVTM